VSDGTLDVQRMSLGPFQANCYIVQAGTDAVVIDPGAEAERLVSLLDDRGVEPRAIVLTHAHADHVGGVSGLVRRFGAPVYLHPADAPLYRAAAEHAALFGIAMESPPEPDAWLEHGEHLSFGSIRLEVRHAPGHSPGGIVLVTPAEAFVGDCVFAGSIGRTDLPGGDTRTLLRSIRKQILSLPPDTTLYTGHGPPTTVAVEAATNPFLVRQQGWLA
jgi:glyoxylase-like metal-dependent hydrolase (beta-lactamase superfamily II)